MLWADDRFHGHDLRHGPNAQVRHKLPRMERPQYSWNRDTPEQSLSALLLKSVSLGFIMAFPSLFAAVLANASNLRGARAIQEIAAWTTALPAVLSLPWILVVSPFAGMFSGDYNPVHMLLGFAGALFICFSINASFAVRRWNFATLAFLALLVSGIQCGVIAQA